MEEWKEYRLGEVCIYNTERIPLNLLNEENYISTENMLPNIGGVTISSNLPTSGNAVHFYNGDILISNIRPYFKKIWYANKEGGCSADVLCIRANKDIDKQYLYYLLSQQDFFDYVMAGAKGCKMPRGDKQHIMNWEISLPSLPTQQKIASILSSLDDKIEVNRRINEQLEELAQALFKSWFVDFEPFKDGDFVESELGMIPKGWKVLSFNDFINPSSEKVFVGELPEYSVTNNGIIPRDEKFKKQLSKTTSKNKVLKKNNLVFGMSRDILNWGIMEDLIGGVSSAYNVYIIDERQICPTYLRLYMSSKIAYFNDLIGNAAREGQSLDKAALLNKKVYFPNDNIWHDFFERYSTIKDNILIREEEITHLTALRDTLLPKLMSGEMDVNEVEL